MLRNLPPSPCPPLVALPGVTNIASSLVVFSEIVYKNACNYVKTKHIFILSHKRQQTIYLLFCTFFLSTPWTQLPISTDHGFQPGAVLPPGTCGLSLVVVDMLSSRDVATHPALLRAGPARRTLQPHTAVALRLRHLGTNGGRQLPSIPFLS